MGGFKRIVLLNLILFIFVILKTESAGASIITINRKGEIVVNVLSLEESIELEIPERDYLEIRDITDKDLEPDAKISLLREDGRVKLQVSSESGDKSLDITDYKDDVIEIEERPKVRRLSIKVSEGNFIIEQGGVVAETEYPINIDPEIARLTVETPTGLRFLSILPWEAVESVLRSKYINKINAENKLSLFEEDKDLTYKVEGDKVINLLDIIKYSTPVSVKVSASTGEIISIEQPTWLKILGFLFV